MAILPGSNEDQIFFDQFGRKVEEEFNALNPVEVEVDPDAPSERDIGKATTLLQDAFAPYLALFQKDMFKAGTKTAQEDPAPTGVMGISDVAQADPTTQAKMASLFVAMTFPIFDATARAVESAVGEGEKVKVETQVPGGEVSTGAEVSTTKVDPHGRVGATAGMAVGGITEALARGVARGLGAVALRRIARRSVQAKLAKMSDADIAKNIELAMSQREISEIPGLPEEVFSRAQITSNDTLTQVKGAPVLNMNVPDRGIHLTMMTEEGEVILGGMSRDPGVKGGIRGADDAVLAAMGHAEKHGFPEVTLGTPAERATIETTKGGKIVVDRMTEAGLIQIAEKEGGKRVASLTDAGRAAVRERFLIARIGDEVSQGALQLRDIMTRVEKVTTVKNLDWMMKRGIVTNRKTAEEALKIPMTVDDLLGRPLGLGFGSSAEATKAALIRDILGEESIAVWDRFLVGEATREEFVQASLLWANVRGKVKAAGSEVGRTLESLKGRAVELAWEQAEATMMDIAKDSLRMGAEMSDKRFTQLVGRMIKGPPGRFGKFMDKMASMPDAILEAYYGTLLGPFSFMRNWAGNTAFLSANVWERQIASVLGREIAPEEAMNIMAGIWASQSAAFKGAFQTAKTGESAFGMMATKVEGASGGPLATRAFTAEAFGAESIPVLNKALDYLGIFYRANPRSLLAADEYFKVINFHGEYYAQARRQAWKEFGGEIAPENVAAYNARYEHLIENPTKEMLSESLFAANDRTFTRDLTGRMASLQKGLSHPIVRILAIPFFRTPARILEASLERTPIVGLLMKQLRTDIAAGGAKAQLALAKQSTGLMLLTTAMILEQQGLITGNGPRNRGLNRHLDSLGHQRNSFWDPVNSRYVSMEGMEPLSSLLAIGADLNFWLRELEVMGVGQDDPRVIGLIAAVSLSISKNFVNRTFMQGTAEFMDALDSSGDITKAAKLLRGRFATAFNPATLKVLTRALDRERKEIHTLAEDIFADIPYFSGWVHPKRNIITGEPLMTEGSMRLFFIPGTEFVNPFFTSSIKDDPVILELVRLRGGGISPPRPVVFGRAPAEFPMRPEQPEEGVPINSAEYDRLIILMTQVVKSGGRNLHQALNAVRQKHEFISRNDQARTNAFQRVYQKYKEKAQYMLVRETPRLQGLIKEKHEQRREALSRRPAGQSPEAGPIRLPSIGIGR